MAAKGSRRPDALCEYSLGGADGLAETLAGAGAEAPSLAPVVPGEPAGAGGIGAAGTDATCAAESAVVIRMATVTPHAVTVCRCTRTVIDRPLDPLIFRLSRLG